MDHLADLAHFSHLAHLANLTHLAYLAHLAHLAHLANMGIVLGDAPTQQPSNLSSCARDPHEVSNT